MTQLLDCRELQCPAPVLKTKQYLEKNPVDQVSIQVDNDAAVENVSRFLNFQGFDVTVDSDPKGSIITGKRTMAAGGPEAAQVSDAPAALPADHSKILVMISADQIGKGDDALGRQLMINFIKTLKEMGRDLWRLVLVNHGVRLAIEDSSVLDELLALEKDGVDILVCGACLTHLGLMDAKRVGQTTNMLDVVTSMQLAEKTINL